jgi:hypothetical protein
MSPLRVDIGPVPGARAPNVTDLAGELVALVSGQGLVCKGGMENLTGLIVGHERLWAWAASSSPTILLSRLISAWTASSGITSTTLWGRRVKSHERSPGAS